MSGSRQGRFSFRMSADDAQQVVTAFRQVSGASDDVKRAFDRLIQSSPQLASVNDNVQRKMRDTAEAMKKGGTAAKEAEQGFSLFGSSFMRSGLIGLGIGSGIELFQQLRQSVEAALAAIPQAGDAATQALSRLRALTGSEVIGADVYRRIQEIASATGSSIDTTVEAFQRFRVAARDLGATSDEVLKLIDGLQKFAVVNGVQGPGLAAATTQLSQALASGTLQGDELKSILENLPQLAQGLARELGVSVGQLRQMGKDGELASSVVFPALQRLLAGINQEFEKMPPSIARARNEMDVAATKLYETLDKAFGLSGAVVAKFQALAGIMNSIARGVQAVTQDERFFTLQKERNDLREEIAAYNQTIAEAGAVPSPDRDAINQLIARRDALQAVLKQKDDAYERERTQAREASDAARLASARATTDEIEQLDKRAAADKELAARKKAIFELFVLTGDAAEMDRLTALAVKDHADAIAKLTQKQKENHETVGKWLADREKLRLSIEKEAASTIAALDPYAAAWQRAADQVDKLIQAVALWEETGGGRGISPDTAFPLIEKAQTGLISTFDQLDRGGKQADRTFDQFFSNIASKAEDAIVNFRSLSDVVNSLGEDIARLLLREYVSNPIAAGIKGFVNDQGGLSGLLKSGWNFISGLFADGGVMTAQGPLPLRRYAAGGVATSPQLAMFGEGSMPEAYVPLPDGRRIPVAMQGGARGDTIVNVNVANSNASPALIAGTVALAVEQSTRRIYADADRGGSAAKRLGRRR